MSGIAYIKRQFVTSRAWIAALTLTCAFALLLPDVVNAQTAGEKGVQTGADLAVGEKGVKPLACATSGAYGAVTNRLFGLLDKAAAGGIGGAGDDADASVVSPGDVLRWAAFQNKRNSPTGDNIEGHEVWQHANQKAHGLTRRRGDTPASRNNPVIALDRAVHREVSRGQTWNAARQTPRQNIEANIRLLRQKGVASDRVLCELFAQAIQHAESFGFYTYRLVEPQHPTPLATVHGGGIRALTPISLRVTSSIHTPLANSWQVTSMKQRNITTELERIPPSDFERVSADRAEEWTTAAVGAEAVDSILKFMEAHPDLDYGSPGALVHFVERFYRKGYEEKLITSIKRRPTPHTVWMLRRLMHSADSAQEKQNMRDLLEQARHHPAAAEGVQESIARFFETDAKQR
jgi:hypothetical protein